MFHDLAVLQPEDVNDRIAWVVADQADPMAVQDDEIAVRKRALDFSMGIRMVVANPLGELANSLQAVFHERVVLLVAFAAIEPKRSLDVPIVQGLFIESDGRLLVLFGHISGLPGDH